jgi:FkbM family methyltransferase
MRKLRLFIKYTIHLGPANFFDYLYQRFFRKSKILFIKVPNLRHKVAIRNNSSDIPLFAHMFILREYDVSIEGEMKTIIDCGANVGLASLFFLSKFPGATIIAIEPERNNYRLLEQNLGKYENVTCINKGVWNKKALLEIQDTGRGNHAFIVTESLTKSESTIEAISIDEIMNEFHLDKIDILKIDIEGSEEQVFLSEPSWIKKVRMIFCEIHETMKPGLTAKIIALLNPYFKFTINAEYHVFKSKVAIQESGIS